MTSKFPSDASDSDEAVKSGVLRAGGGGPLGIGDPEDRGLRRVEKDVLIPKIIRERTREEKCSDYYQAFEACGKATGLAMVYKCREENSKMKKCMEYWYTEPSFVQECTELYLKERSEFRRTGMMKPKAERRGTKAYREARKAAELASEAASSSSVGGSVKA